MHAVCDVSFEVDPGETLSLVGESGCGKSTTGRLRAATAAGRRLGRCRFKGREVFGLDRGAMRAVREDIQIVFQDPYASLNPRMTVHALSPSRCGSTVGTAAMARTGRASCCELVGLSPEHADAISA